MVTQNYLLNAFEYKDGRLFWIVKRKGTNGFLSMAGTSNRDGYRYIGIGRKRYAEHRIVFLFHNGWLPENIDHINQIKDDNRIENLRAATSSDNHCNKPMLKNNTSGYKGVSFFKRDNKWAAHICFKKIQKHLGLFKSPELAHEAYKRAAIELHGEFANY